MKRFLWVLYLSQLYLVLKIGLDNSLDWRHVEGRNRGQMPNFVQIEGRRLISQEGNLSFKMPTKW